MNRTKIAVSAAALITSALAMPALAQGTGNGNGNSNANTLPAAPIGALSATPNVVQTGTFPTLNWNILYPSRVSDVAVIAPPGTLTLTENMYVHVRAVGVGTSNPGEARISVNGGGYEQVFYGTNTDVDPTHPLYVKKHNSGSTIDFGGRYVENNTWSPFYTTRSSNAQVVSLVDGDAIPTNFDLNQSGNMAEYLRPYVDSTGRVDIGPLSVLVMGEYNSNAQSSGNFDYQDFVLLVTLAPKNNNGHGNNVDGVDVSNPGGGSGGPNGQVDPSGGVDDEIR